MKLNKLLLLIIAVLVMSCAKEKKAGFAIVVDERSYNEAGTEIESYAKSIEQQGLTSIIIVDKWHHPDSIRMALKKLYLSADNKLEGAVFVGDIPVAMLRGTQHLTTAFKMDESKFPINRASIPSDRFYEDFDLEFDFIKQDEKNPSLFYFNLKAESPQHLDVDIYSGRIKPAGGDDKYKKLKSYLNKVVEYKQNPTTVDQIMFFSGHGYTSESFRAFMDEKITINQQFEYLISQKNFIEYINFRFDTHSKFRLLAELKRKDLDIAFLHHHGGKTAQYLNGMPMTKSNQVAIDNVKYYLRSKLRSAKRRKKDLTETKKGYQEWMGIPLNWFEGSFDSEQIKKDSIFNANLDIYTEDLEDYSSNARFIQFDACFNGSFQLDKYISGEYIFDEGNTITVQANSVNSLQDKWPGEMAGLMGLGIRIGQWNKMVCSLETHIIGDPTFCFNPNDKNLDVNKLINFKKDDLNFWKKQLNSEYADMQALGLRMIYKLKGKEYSEFYLDKFKSSKYNSVRTEAFKILRLCNNEEFLTAIHLGINDAYEYIQRRSATYMGKTGDESNIPYLIGALLRNTSGKRVFYQLRDAAAVYDKTLLLAELNKQIEEKGYFLDKTKTKEELTKLIENKTEGQEKNINELLDPEISEKEKYNNLRAFRNTNVHIYISDIIGFLKTTESEKLKLTGIEMLSWFEYSTNKEQIIKFCEEVIKDQSSSEAYVNEAIKTINQIK